LRAERNKIKGEKEKGKVLLMAPLPAVSGEGWKKGRDMPCPQPSHSFHAISTISQRTEQKKGRGGKKEKGENDFLLFLLAPMV